jgi:hypothetical protein
MLEEDFHLLASSPPTQNTNQMDSIHLPLMYHYSKSMVMMGM